MTIVAIVEAFTLALVVAAFLADRRRTERQHDRRVDLLLNQALHAAGKPWQPAPADTTAQPNLSDDEPRPRYTATPEQYPA